MIPGRSNSSNGVTGRSAQGGSGRSGGIYGGSGRSGPRSVTYIDPARGRSHENDGGRGGRGGRGEPARGRPGTYSNEIGRGGRGGGERGSARGRPAHYGNDGGRGGGEPARGRPGTYSNEIGRGGRGGGERGSSRGRPGTYSNEIGRGGRAGRSYYVQKDKVEVKEDFITILPVINKFPLVDIGVNLAHSLFNRDRNDVIQRAKLHGVTTLVCTGTNERASITAAELAAKYPGVLYSTAGIHPHDAKHWNPNTLDNLRELAQRSQVVAIGECGLDFDRNFSTREEQLEAFERQVLLAVELEKPLFCHERQAFPEFVEILQKYFSKLGKVCVHCFTGTEEQLRTYLQLGIYIGITGWICDDRRGQELQKIVKLIPLNRILIETDAPFLTPRNKSPLLRHVTRNEPCLLPFILKQLSECMEISESELAVCSTENAKFFFGIKE